MKEIITILIMAITFNTYSQRKVSSYSSSEGVGIFTSEKIENDKGVIKNIEIYNLESKLIQKEMLILEETEKKGGYIIRQYKLFNINLNRNKDIIIVGKNIKLKTVLY